MTLKKALKTFSDEVWEKLQTDFLIPWMSSLKLKKNGMFFQHVENRQFLKYDFKYGHSYL